MNTETTVEFPRGTVISVRKLSVGEVIEPTDVYLSTSGKWERVPISGVEVADNGVEWARPKYPDDRRTAIMSQKERKK